MTRERAPSRSAWGSFDRAEALRRLERDHFDVVVVGGGITGAGTALDAASRGLRTALVEQHDFASGTSSRSSKLVHGGLRYLQNGEIRLVYEALAERQILRRNAPHLVEVLPFLIPILTTGGVVDRRLARAFGSALWTYDLTGGLRIGHRHRRLSPDAALAHVPTLRSERLAGAYLYYDAHVDDARLTLAIVRTAALHHGVVAANRCRVVGIDSGEAGDGGHLSRRRIKVEADVGRGGGRRSIEITASVVVNATGAWADHVQALEPGAAPAGPMLRPAKGVHLAVPRAKVGNDIAVVLPVPDDRRSVFVVPWGDITYVGTTDTDYDGPLDEPECTPDDIAYLLDALNAALSEQFGPDDVLSTWAGLRPLIDSTPGGAAGERTETAALSRRHRVTVSPSGLVTVIGGKLTTYRRMAADTVDAALAVIEGRPSRHRPVGVHPASRTKRLALIGAENCAEAEAIEPHLARRYGGETHVVLAMIERNPALGEPLGPGLPYLRAEALFAVRYEMATTLDDVLVRRTRAHLFDREASVAAAPAVAELVAVELGWDADEIDRQVATYRQLAADERDAATVGKKRASGVTSTRERGAAVVPPERHR